MLPFPHTCIVSSPSPFDRKSSAFHTTIKYAMTKININYKISMQNIEQNNNHIFSSKEVIEMALDKLELSRESNSTYKQYEYQNGEYLRLRVSDHGLYLQHWYDKNKEARMSGKNVPRMNIGLNIAITFSPNKDECDEMGQPFPMKIKNDTSAKTENGNNVKPQFVVRHICYNTWELTQEEVNSIIEALYNCVLNGTNYIEPLGMSSSKVSEWEDTSNLPPKRIQGEKLKNSRDITNNQQDKDMKTENRKRNAVRLTESQLKQIVNESVKKILSEVIGRESPKEISYRLMVMLGEIQNELNRGGEPVSLDEINGLYDMASQLNDYFENSDY